MKNIFALFIFALFIIAAVVAYKTPFSFCDIPITYKLGTIDSRFKLNRSVALQDIDQAAKIIDSAYNKKIFNYVPDSGEYTINFIYDERTALESNINKQKTQITKEDATLQEKIKAYEADVSVFEQKLANLNATIEKYNNSGGAPQDVYEELIKEQNQLRLESEALNARATQLNLKTNDFNSKVQDFNQDISEFKKAIEIKPEEGLFDGANKTITIYFVNTKAELIHTLTHEFGHALGMDHVSDPNAIMYLQTSENLKFTDADKRELGRVCQSFPLPNYWIYLLRQKISGYLAQGLLGLGNQF